MEVGVSQDFEVQLLTPKCELPYCIHFILPLNGAPGDSCGGASLRASSMSFCASCQCHAVLPSPFAFFLRKGPIPFVIGPINGGLPWPSGFQAARKAEGMGLRA